MREFGMPADLEAEKLLSENNHLRTQLSLLSKLTYRVASSLELDLVLQEVVDAACELTAARFGALALVDEAGQFQRLFSHGLSAEQRESLGELPHGRGILGVLHRMDGPLRLRDLTSHSRYTGFPVDHPTMTTFLGTNIENEGVAQGSLYLADKLDGLEFSAEDEELLKLFGLQAAAAIRNARRFEESQAARLQAEASRQALKESEARLVEELKELQKLRTDLLAAIAHEFKTPLTAIRTAVGVLEDPTLTMNASQERRLLHAISQSAVLMQRLVTDFVDLARFQSGAIRLDVGRFDARGLARNAVQTMSTLFQAHRQTVAIAAPRQAVWLVGDRRRLEQALLNLLSNAQKFAPDGTSITVQTAVDAGNVMWSVTDTGPGIPASAQPLLFKRFFTLPNSDSRQSSGTGLGLPIAMAIAQAHNGTIEVLSAPGKGSTFTLKVRASHSPPGEST
jgi:signal transduction histidine kinase